MKRENPDSYEDIIHLSRPVSRRRPSMPILDRAAQFAPFAALTGYGDVVKEAERLTDRKIELSEDQKALLDERFRRLAQTLHGETGEIYREPEVVITYFQPDCRKEGGIYVTAVGRVQKMDEFRRMLRLADGTEIPIENVLDIQYGDFGNGDIC